MRSIDAVRSISHELRSVDRISARRVKRVVQGMIDSMDGDPSILLNLATLKNYDEYTFNHSVNVSVQTIALGRHVGLTRQQLYTVGQAGMFHDLGKLCIPKDILTKPGRLTPEERRTMEGHTVEGFISVARKLGVSAETIDIALTAFEHDVNVDDTGYPRPAASRTKGLFSRIVSIVDRYDAMTTDRPYRAAVSPQKALAILFHVQRQDHDYNLLKYFMCPTARSRSSSREQSGPSFATCRRCGSFSTLRGRRRKARLWTLPEGRRRATNYTSLRRSTQETTASR